MPILRSCSPQLLSPLLFITTLYIIFDLVGRLARLDLDVDRAKKLSCLGIGPRTFNVLFHGSNIVAFIIQINGIWVSGSNGGTRQNAGADFLDTGFSLNLVFLTLFFLILTHFDRRTKKEYRGGTGGKRPWYPVLVASYVNWTFIMVIFCAPAELILGSHLLQCSPICSRLGEFTQFEWDIVLYLRRLRHVINTQIQNSR